MSMSILAVVALSGAMRTVVAADEQACLRAARSIAQTAPAAGLAQVSCTEVTRGRDGRFTLTGKPMSIVWQRPHAGAAGPQGDAFAALADPQECQPYEQQSIDIARQPLRLDIWVEP